VLSFRAAIAASQPSSDCGVPALEPILHRHATSIAIINDVDSFVIDGGRVEK
jgi:hypothetical protein